MPSSAPLDAEALALAARELVRIAVELILGQTDTPDQPAEICAGRENRPDIVLVARDRYFTYRKLALAANAVSHGAQLFVAAPYRSHPGPHGQPIPETSSFGGVLDRLHAIRSTLPPTAGRIADFIIANATEMVHMSVTEVAERTEAWLACASCSARAASSR